MNTLHLVMLAPLPRSGAGGHETTVELHTRPRARRVAPKPKEDHSLEDALDKQFHEELAKRAKLKDLQAKTALAESSVARKTGRTKPAALGPHVHSLSWEGLGFLKKLSDMTELQVRACLSLAKTSKPTDRSAGISYGRWVSYLEYELASRQSKPSVKG